jgi:hypothetical protein
MGEPARLGASAAWVRREKCVSFDSGTIANDLIFCGKRARG